MKPLEAVTGHYVTLELDGRQLRIAAGEVVEERLAEFLSLSLPGVADVNVIAGAGAAERFDCRGLHTRTF